MHQWNVSQQFDISLELYALQMRFQVVLYILDIVCIIPYKPKYWDII